ncbi:HlyD family secretion protein [Pararhodospirillum photometricum]|nr:HlyD family efflux transporter periplasmic adaptor subunit [Pararhodospirillum photometricum]
MTPRSQLWFVLAVLGLAGCDPAPAPSSAHGYVEGDMVHLAAPAGGWLEQLAVAEGETVAPGALLFQLDATRERAALAEAEARADQARHTLADLRTGERPEALAVLAAQRDEAEAGQTLAQRELARQQGLVGSGAASRTRLDQARAEADAARARVATLTARLAEARLPARPEALQAAEATLRAAEAAVAQARWALAQRQITSPVAGRIDDTVRRVGEWVPAGGTVIALLPPEAVRVVFFVPEAERARFTPGTPLAVRCDGCPAPVPAQVARIAAEAEYTPPVIYSQETRAKMVFRVEARFIESPALAPGQPVTVAPATGAPVS